MTILQFIKNYNLNKTLLIGYYGGGNFGDELLLLVLLELFKKNNIKNVDYIYRSDYLFNLFEIKNQYNKVNNNLDLVKKIFANNNIIVGGGGHWGVDMNKSVLIMSILLFISKYILRKKVYLIGIGFYNSTSILGKFAGFISAISSDVILARDNETYNNFKKYNTDTYLDKDIVFNINEVNLDNYPSDSIERKIKIDKKEKYIFITTRRFQKHIANDYNKYIQTLVKKNPKIKFILMTMEPKTVDSNNYEYLKQIKKTSNNVIISDFCFNSLKLTKWLKGHSKNLAIIAPQYHMQMVAHLLNIPHMPISYDNKVSELLKDFGVKKIIPIKNLQFEDLTSFVKINTKR